MNRNALKRVEYTNWKIDTATTDWGLYNGRWRGRAGSGNILFDSSGLVTAPVTKTDT